LDKIKNSTVTDFPEIYTKLLTFNGDEKDFLLRTLMSEWAWIDPIGAASFASNISDKEDAKSAVQYTISGWKREDLTKGFKWIRSLDDSEFKQFMIESFFSANSLKEPHLMAQFLIGLTEGEFKSGIISRMAQMWAQTDPHEALAWASQLPSGPNRSEAISIIAEQISRKSPLDAVTIFDSLPFGKSRDDLLIKLARNWILSDSGKALSWIEGLEIPDRNRAVLSIAEEWAHLNPLDAISYAKKFSHADMGQRRSTIRFRLG
jgi:hypothetical protein